MDSSNIRLYGGKYPVTIVRKAQSAVLMQPRSLEICGVFLAVKAQILWASLFAIHNAYEDQPQGYKPERRLANSCKL